MNAEATMRRQSNTVRLYERRLPGSGFVAIDVVPSRSLLHGRCYDGQVLVERRANDRCEGDEPPVIAEASGKSVESVLRQLLPAAECNWTIGSALLRRCGAAR